MNMRMRSLEPYGVSSFEPLPHLWAVLGKAIDADRTGNRFDSFAGQRDLFR